MRMLLGAVARQLFGIPVLAMAVGIVMVASDLGDLRPEDRPVRSPILDDPEHQRSCRSCAVIREMQAELGEKSQGSRAASR